MISEVNGLCFNATVYYVPDGYYYRKNVTRGYRVHLQCAVSSTCPGRASMPLELHLREANALRITQEHDHPPQPLWIEAALLKKRILQRCAAEATALRTVYDEEIARVRLDVSAAVPYHTFSQNMYRARRRVQGPIPATLLEYGTALEASDRYGCTIQGGQFYRATLVDDNGGTAVVFVSPTLEERLTPACTHAHADATFRVTPAAPQCYQLLTLSIISFDQAFPLVSVLMTGKTENLYNLVFAFITNINPEWAPTVVTSDFESALQNSLRRAWPAAHIVGCWFHVANCMNKKARKLGHHAFLQHSPVARKTYKMCQVLPLLPADQVQAGYDSIVEYAERNHVLLPLVTFLNYVFRVWVTGVGAQSMSVYRQRRRTNNDMESYHRKLRDVMGRPHPNIWVFTDGLRTLENSAASAMVSLAQAQHPLRPTRPRYLLSNQVIARLTARLDAQEYTVGEFLEAASHCIDNVHNRIYNQVVNEESGDEAVEDLVPAWLPPDNDHPAAPALVGRGGLPQGRGAARGRAAPGRAAPGRAVQGRAGLGRAAPGRAAPGRAVQGRAGLGRAAPGRAAPGRAAPGRAVQRRAGLGRAAPGRAVQGRAAPGRAAPGRAAPGRAVQGRAGLGRAARGRAGLGLAARGRAARGQAGQRPARGRGGRGRRGGHPPYPQLAGEQGGGALLAAAEALAAAAAMIPPAGAGAHLALIDAVRAAAGALLVPPPAAVVDAAPAAEPNPDNPPAALPDVLVVPNVPDDAPLAAQAVELADVVQINRCLVCLEHRRDMMFSVGCGHVAVCEDCAAQLQDQRCVACREQVVGLHRVQFMH